MKKWPNNRPTFTKNEDCAPSPAQALAQFEQEHGVTLPRDSAVRETDGQYGPGFPSAEEDGA